MSEFSYCDGADLRFLVPSIDQYDSKRILPSNWVASGTTHLFYLYDSGTIDQCYVDGVEMTLVADTPNADNEYKYNSTTDLLELFQNGGSANTLNSSIVESGIDFSTHISTAISRASDYVRSVAGVPIYKRKGVSTASATGHDFPEVIVLSTAAMACYYLIAPYDLEKANELKSRVTNDEGTGDLDKIRNGNIVLYQDETSEKLTGIIKEVSIHSNTTGSIIDVRGVPTQWDKLKIKITSGGTLSYGSASSITFDVYGKASNGLKINKIIDSQTLSGNWDIAGNNMEILASDGVYTTNDEWELETNPRIATRTQPIKYGRVGRV
tara:strand:+ start:17974 stop:18945 length:972 start_codon:yes stop_codon:yes gene_type:complete